MTVIRLHPTYFFKELFLTVERYMHKMCLSEPPRSQLCAIDW